MKHLTGTYEHALIVFCLHAFRLIFEKKNSFPVQVSLGECLDQLSFMYIKKRL